MTCLQNIKNKLKQQSLFQKPTEPCSPSQAQARTDFKQRQEKEITNLIRWLIFVGATIFLFEFIESATGLWSGIYFAWYTWAFIIIIAIYHYKKKKTKNPSNDDANPEQHTP